ncbi:MAG TPA: primosomal protein N' [Fimbriimonadaceae bacterium]|nr:primosomal protein N' [Fimbriimonadaceae bacterium]
MALTVIDVAIEAKAGGGDRLWSYRAPDHARVGAVYFVPLGRRSVLGYCVGVRKVDEADLGFPVSSLRDPDAEVDGLALPNQLVELILFVAERTWTPIPVALQVATPPGVGERLTLAWLPTSDGSGEAPLTALQSETLRVLQEQGRITESGTKKLPGNLTRALKLLQGKGLARRAYSLTPFAERRQAVTLLRLTSDQDRIEAFLRGEGKKKPAQAMTLMRLSTAEKSALTAVEIRILASVTDQTVKSLVSTGLLEEVGDEQQTKSVAPTPSAQQSNAIQAISAAIVDRTATKFLLYGVTGSGKTEVYLRATAEALKQGRQVLYLVPEIALATQALAALRDRFGSKVAIMHSDLPNRERLETWGRIRDGGMPIVLGARSALFAPLSNLGLVVVDEEHETSYKQESSPRYHARTIAERLAELHSCPLVLGSATPSVETFYAAEQGVYQRLNMPLRAAEATLPQVSIVDLSEGYRSRQPALLSPELILVADEALRRGEQVILFLNRRAYSPFLICRECGVQFSCPKCAVSLSFSRREGRLRCHHCGYAARPPDLCPSCGGSKLSPVGVGTEKVEEAVSDAFPGVAIARLDRDVAAKKGALEDILAKFRSGETQILVGTQMVAKGLDFPNVTVVGVVAADVSLNIPDFRSAERTFQLLSQVAGRAGRGRLPGKVVIQTFNPRHEAVVSAAEHDYGRMYNGLLEERKQALYPPFVTLVNVVFSGENRQAVSQASMDALSALQSLEDAVLLGPVDCAIERIQNRWRRHLIVKLPPDAGVSSVGRALDPLEVKGVQRIIDVDPYSMS